MGSRIESLALDLARELARELREVSRRGKVVIAIDSDFDEFVAVEEAPSDEDLDRVDRIAQLMLSIAYCFGGRVREEVYRLLRESAIVRDIAREAPPSGQLDDDSVL